MEKLKPSYLDSQNNSSTGKLSPLGLAWDHPYAPMPDPHTGHLSVDPDIVLRSQKFNLEISFYYSSEATGVETWLGKQRDISVHQYVLGGSLQSPVTITRGDFSQWPFSQVGSTDNYVASAVGCPSTLVFGSTWTEYFPDGSQQTYNPPPPHHGNQYLKQVVDAAGVTNTYNYGVDGTFGVTSLISIQLPGDRTVSFTGDVPKIVEGCG